MIPRVLGALCVLGGMAAAAPPTGWNSWDSYGLSVTEPEFKANTTVLAQKLRPHGWTYAVVDEGWYLKNPAAKPGQFVFTLDGNGRYIAAPGRFAGGMKGLADWTHAQGLKFGIHIIRGIPRQAVAQNTPIAGSSFHARDAADTNDACPWNADNFGVKDNAAGQAYYDSLGKLYADWGVDLVKVDCISSRPYRDAEIHMVSKAFQKTGRPIVLSLSPGPTPLDKAADAKQWANMWRISNDFWDHWKQWPEKERAWSQGALAQFKTAAQWGGKAAAGRYPDADMLPFGYLGPRPGYGQARQSGLSEEEEKTVLTLWSMLQSPLIMGGNLTKLDAYTLSLMTADEVLAVDQHGAHGHAVVHAKDKAVWVAQSDDGAGTYLALFNLSDSPQTIAYPLQTLGSVSYRVRDVWNKRELGTSDMVKATLAPHASALYRLH